MVCVYIETSVDTFARTKPTDLFDAEKSAQKVSIFVFFNVDGEYPACNFRKKRKPTIFTACFNARPGVIHLFSRQTVHAVQEIKLFLP